MKKLLIFLALLISLQGFGQTVITSQSGDRLMDAGKGTFDSGTESWITAGNNTIENDNGSLKITYIDNDDGAATPIRIIGDLSTYLILGKTYKLRMRLKINSGGASTRILQSGSIITAFSNTDYEWHEVVWTCNQTNSTLQFYGMGGSEIIWIDEWYIVEVEQEPTITDITYVKEAELIVSKYNGSTTMTDLGYISDPMTGDLTAMAWIKPHSVGEGGAGRIIANHKFTFSLTSPFSKQVFVSSDGGGTWKYSANDIWAIDKWSHVIVTRTAAGVTNIYKNLVLSGAADESSGTPAAPTEKTIVGNSNTGGNTIDGLLGEVRVFKGILNAYERDQIFQQERRLYNV